MNFFSEAQVLKIHSSLIAKTGGIDGIREFNLLDSSLKSVFQTFDGRELYPEILDKAVQLCYSIIKNHPFLDGNKRIGIHLSLVFLKINGIDLHYTQEELIDFGFGIASGKINNPDAKHRGYNAQCFALYMRSGTDAAGSMQ
ncbi:MULTISPECIES: type II toxin-antitoxin system death-on-curing family toxin [unclassified Treponema]|uniref:type II toxin-antitoxin system death-on-curing family toxin n=1 Tax=unclassified Treponema TaxID=2638727 RepID=UPI0020A4BDD9|nr:MULTISPECIES: type II toxin-antitoxin system death-on-curing family toxin [unclassified Treponema]UTC67122.1 type II toxin-antitoxin system death-on-curing family toxin [Treponema sp. OMZ 789]UTC69853.1 type II toxin-antitoxin system death-on-curing family toxin [Treponema sp. OMZ 790]UTC72567.1 type II toxin-antitoxin system death-on-curing family toxin [Treponema sp. OMZ 791]